MPKASSTASLSRGTARRLRPRRSGRRSPRPGWARTHLRPCWPTARPGCGGCSARCCRVQHPYWTGGTPPCGSNTRCRPPAASVRARPTLASPAERSATSNERSGACGTAAGRGCRRKLAALRRWTKRKHMRDVAGIGRLQRHVAELLGYLERNRDALVHYAARRRRGEPISTAFVESAVNEIVAKRMNK